MKKHSKPGGGWIYRLLNDSRFFVFSLALFTVHSAWLALSAQSLPFDEYFHLGIIKLYAGHLSPFLTSQPPEVSYLGDLTRLPSYLYGYLMSFPYRFFSLFTDSQYVITVLLRGINIALVIAGLILWRRLLLKIGVSRRIAHLTLFVFMMLPLVILVAAENNYDNLMFALTPIFLGLAYDIANGKFTVKNLIGFISLGMVTCLVKNQFLVIFGITTLLVAILVLKRYGLKNIGRKVSSNLKATKWPILVLWAAVLIISSGLFIERLGMNVVRYHSINLDCAKVQPISVCYQYSPWQRDYNTLNTKTGEQLFGNPASFSVHWVATMTRGFIANFANVLQGAKPWDPYGNYILKPILPLLIITVYTVLAASAVSFILNFRKWWQINWIRYSILLVFCYSTVLWLFNYSSYLKNGRPFAIQSRYLYPLLILILACSAQLILMLIKNRTLANRLAALVIIVLVLNGGALGWMLYADKDWYWPNPNNIKINQAIQPVLNKSILHTREY